MLFFFSLNCLLVQSPFNSCPKVTVKSTLTWLVEYLRESLSFFQLLPFTFNLKTKDVGERGQPLTVVLSVKAVNMKFMDKDAEVHYPFTWGHLSTFVPLVGVWLLQSQELIVACLRHTNTAGENASKGCNFLIIQHSPRTSDMPLRVIWKQVQEDGSLSSCPLDSCRASA